MCQQTNFECSKNRIYVDLKTEFMLIGLRQKLAALEGDVILANDGISLRKVSKTKCLGIQIDENLTWDAHILSVRQKVTRNLNILKRIKPIINRENLMIVYRSIVEPYFNYCKKVSDTYWIN